MGMDDISEIQDLAAPKQNPLLGKKLEGVNQKIKEIEEAKKKLDNTFQVNQWGSITDYQKLVSAEIESVNGMGEALRAADIAVEFCFKKDTIPDIVGSLEQLRVVKERLEGFIEQDKESKINLIKNRLVNEYRGNQSFLREAELVSQSDIAKLREDLVKYTEKENAYQAVAEALEKKRMMLESREISAQDDAKVVYLSETMAHEFEKDRELLDSLYAEGEGYGIKPERRQKRINIGRFLYYTAVHRNWIETYTAVLEEKEKSLKMVEGIRDSQKEMLLKVQEYVNTRDMLEKCPVCGGTAFYNEEEDAKEKLLSIIGKAIADGNEAAQTCNEEILSCRKWIHRVEESYRKWVWERFISERRELEQDINQCIQMISEKLGKIIQCNDKMRNSIRVQREKTQEKVTIYDAFEQKYELAKETLDLKIIKTRKANQWIRSILIEKLQVQADDIEALDAVCDTLKYDLGEENLKLLQRYATADAETGQLETKKKLYQGAADFRNTVNKAAKDIEKEMINLVFEFINPHPFYRQLRIVKSGAETNMVPAGKDKRNIYLDHLFSEAQLRVLSLSIFLGLNLSAKDNNFGQIYIDDPVQSMDDINMVSFIDLLRALKRSDRVDKNLIIGTHDFDFSKLLKIKFRHPSYVEYYFDSYMREGPRIVKRQQGIK